MSLYCTFEIPIQRKVNHPCNAFSVQALYSSSIFSSEEERKGKACGDRNNLSYAVFKFWSVSPLLYWISAIMREDKDKRKKVMKDTTKT